MVQKISLKGTLISLIESIDMFNYLLKNHHRRVTIISYNLGKYIGLSENSLKNLVFASSLHDIGALSVDERNRLIKMDVESPRSHEVIGCAMLKSFEPFVDIANIIYHHHIKFSEVGTLYPESEIPEECFLLHLADRIDILIDPTKPVLPQVPTIMETINSYEDLFAPWCIDAFKEVAVQENFWLDIDFKSLDLVLNELTPSDMDIIINEQDLEELAFTFSRIVDYRSKFTAAHSLGVGMVAFELAKLAGLSIDQCYKIKIAGYLHDIGKIAIPTEIIEKEGSLTEEEFDQVKLHSYYTYVILSRIKGLEDVCNWASKHHEKYDGSGYPYHISESEFSIELDILAYADIFTSLSEERPYRNGSVSDETLSILSKYSKKQLSQQVYQLIEDNYNSLDKIRNSAQNEGILAYELNIQETL